MSLQVYLAFVAACIALALVPGPCSAKSSHYFVSGLDPAT
jgi:threonine/homoserine/homoserine lactone efflux protein